MTRGQPRQRKLAPRPAKIRKLREGRGSGFLQWRDPNADVSYIEPALRYLYEDDDMSLIEPSIRWWDRLTGGGRSDRDGID
jgi:hypothetical protein